MTADRPKPLPLPIVLDACQDTMHINHSKRALAWHFLAGPLPGVLRDGRPAPADGEILRHDGPPLLCEQGLHASVHALDAANYARGPIVCRVECGGTVQHGGDKLVCTERRILWRADADATLRAFALWCALSVIHLRDPAGAAAWAARAARDARDASGAAARAAARADAKDAQNVRLEEMLLALAPRNP